MNVILAQTKPFPGDYIALFHGVVPAHVHSFGVAWMNTGKNMAQADGASIRLIRMKIRLCTLPNPPTSSNTLSKSAIVSPVSAETMHFNPNLTTKQIITKKVSKWYASATLLK